MLQDVFFKMSADDAEVYLAFGAAAGQNCTECDVQSGADFITPHNTELYCQRLGEAVRRGREGAGAVEADL